jgi:hypothetical protein
MQGSFGSYNTLSDCLDWDAKHSKFMVSSYSRMRMVVISPQELSRYAPGEWCLSCPIVCCVSPEIPPSGVSCGVSLRGIILGESRVFGLGLPLYCRNHLPDAFAKRHSASSDSPEYRKPSNEQTLCEMLGIRHRGPAFFCQRQPQTLRHERFPEKELRGSAGQFNI